MSQQVAVQDKDIAQIANQHSGSRRFGPVEITYNMNIAEEEATVSASIMGVSLGTTKLNMEHQQSSLGGNVSLYHALIELDINFSEKEVGGGVEVTMMGKVIFKSKITLLDW
ncbi:hypothetical protein [uncultured Tenacibaculum sp.]|uniref:hypothetical protein n=1 Tax=uncultured Tenacibaculum sp. TaxID=174713 RepID=UPI00262E54CD|nr:hypothetical protein [uncultured Tenacibaculum sp.]